MKKKANRTTSSKTAVKRVTRKFHVVVEQQQRQRNVQKSVLHVQSCFLLIRPIVVAAVIVFFAVLNAVAVYHYTIVFFV